MIKISRFIEKKGFLLLFSVKNAYLCECVAREAPKILIDFTLTSMKTLKITILLFALLAVMSSLVSCDRKPQYNADELRESSGVLDGHEYVVIGGKKWAKMNLGATSIAAATPVAAHPGFNVYDRKDYYSCYGMYFKWGETASPSPTPYEDDFLPALFNCDKKVLCPAHDVVRTMWGPNWRMPTDDDFQALYEACGGSGKGLGHPVELSPENRDINGIYWCPAFQLDDGTNFVPGMLFVQDAKHKVFFPAAGAVSDTTLYLAGMSGVYWSSRLNPADNSTAYTFNFSNGGIDTQNALGRCYGLSIRPVAD